jgi:HSP20 family molecular chaperone IbpA
MLNTRRSFNSPFAIRFIVAFEMPSTLEESILSAKWRRSRRDSKRFNIFKVIRRVKKKNVFQKTRLQDCEVKRRPRMRRYTVQRVSGEKSLREPKPLVDVLERDDDIAVIVEFAGFDREDLRIHLRDQRLTLTAETVDRKFHKCLNLPKRVIPSTICTTYKNGVLEIRLKKAVEEKAMGKAAG